MPLVGGTHGQSPWPRECGAPIGRPESGRGALFPEEHLDTVITRTPNVPEWCPALPPISYMGTSRSCGTSQSEGTHVAHGDAGTCPASSRAAVKSRWTGKAPEHMGHSGDAHVTLVPPSSDEVDSLPNRAHFCVGTAAPGATLFSESQGVGGGAASLTSSLPRGHSQV